MWEGLLGIIRSLRCSVTSALVIISKKRQFYGLGSLQLRSMAKNFIGKFELFNGCTCSLPLYLSGVCFLFAFFRHCENCILSFIKLLLPFVVDLGYRLRNCGLVFFKMMMKHSLYGVMR